MSDYSLSVDIPRPAADVFAFLACPANLVELAPPDMRLTLIEGPARLYLGALLHWKARRLGVSQALVNEITVFDESVLIEERQRHGPFKAWHMRQRLEPNAAGTRLMQELTYEPPGGMLGLLVSADAVHRELERLFAYRGEQLLKLLAT